MDCLHNQKKKKKIINFSPPQRIKSSRVDDKLSSKAKMGEWLSDHYFYGDNHKKGGTIKSLSHCIFSLLMYHMVQFSKDSFYSLQAV